MKILFYHPTAHSEGHPEPPLGIGYLMSVAKRLHQHYEFYDEDHHSTFLSLETIVSDFKPDLYVVSFMTPQYYKAIKVIQKFKDWTPKAKVIVGGPHASALSVETMQELKEIDYLCKGEGEKTFEEFLGYLNGKMPLEEVNGLFYRKDGKIFTNTPRELMSSRELDNCSVDWEKLLEQGPYMQKLVYTKTIVPALSVITARGCPFGCTFCDEGNMWQRKVRMRSIDNVIKEIMYLQGKYSIEHINVLDDTFTLSKSRVIEFCQKIKPLKIKFRITAKTTTVDEEMLDHLKQAGCQIIAYGVESGDEEVLKKMKKQQTIKDIKNAFEITRRADIPSYALCMVGNIGEDMKAVKKTAELIKEIKPDLFSCSLMTPYPGSENYKTCKDNGWILHYDWELWVPSVLKMKDFKPVARTDKMDEKDLLKAYYLMNRYVLINRFKQKYGRLFIFSFFFYTNEVFPRVKLIGYKAFFHYFINIFLKKKKIKAFGI
jgi:radical SAM superfamily enzyme YgiQ (UPF0313 family)